MRQQICLLACGTTVKTTMKNLKWKVFIIWGANVTKKGLFRYPVSALRLPGEGNVIAGRSSDYEIQRLVDII